MDDKQKIDSVIRDVEEIVHKHEDKNLVLGSLAFWVAELIAGSENPDKTIDNIFDLIRKMVVDR